MIIDKFHISPHDSELSMYFDIALMECIRFNELHKVNRCVLCLKQCWKLQRSHIVPKSILQNFRKAMKQYSGNMLFQVDSTITQAGGKYFSDKTLTRYMLCGDCEANLNVNGEEQFYKHFFQKIYDPSNENCLDLSYQISYENWLYHFCIGLIFRGISAFTGIPQVCNFSDIYNTFTYCRKYLMNTDLPKDFLPSVFVFINPTSTESEQNWLQEILVGPGIFYFSKNNLDDGVSTPHQVAQFFLAKIGIINIVTSFIPAGDTVIAEINPNGGVYNVPNNEQRHLPAGIKEAYSFFSSQQRQSFQNLLFKSDPYAPKSLSSNDMYADERKSYKLAYSIDRDKEKVQEQLEAEGNLFMNCLPPNFTLDWVHGIVKFPSPYVYLLHYCINLPEDLDVSENPNSSYYYEILFIGVKHLDQCVQPLFVLCEHDPKQCFCYGFVFSPDDYSIIEHISDVPLDSYPTPLADRIKEICAAFIPIVVPLAIKACGFSNVHSLLYHYCHK